MRPPSAGGGGRVRSPNVKSLLSIMSIGSLGSIASIGSAGSILGISNGVNDKDVP